jgi:hypothetical protein
MWHRIKAGKSQGIVRVRPDGRLLTLDGCRVATPEQLPEEIYEFTDSRQAEVLARCCRVWIARNTLDPDSVHLAEGVLKVGLTTGAHKEYS